MHGLENLLTDIYEIYKRLGKDGLRAAPEKTDLGKRQSLFEKEVADFLLNKPTKTSNIVIEGYEPSDAHAQETLWVDPFDGTASGARSIDCSHFDHSLPFSTVISISIRHFSEKQHFKHFTRAGALDLHTGQIWIVNPVVGARVISGRTMAESSMERKQNYHRHSPRLACEYYRHINWTTRLLINQPVEWTDMPSSFLNILRAVVGETDCFFNNVVPEFSNEGQRGHELGAISVFARALGAYAMDTRTGGPLAESEFTFDGMTPVIVGVDQETVEHYWGMIQRNLEKKIPKLGITMGEAIGLIHRTAGTERWSLRDLPF